MGAIVVRRILPPLLATLLASCRFGGREGSVVGFAYTRPSAPYLVLARALDSLTGVPIPTFWYDSGAAVESSDQALAFATALTERKDVGVVVGPSNSRHALATAPAYNAAHLAQIIPSATSRRLRDAGPYTFTLAPDDSVEGDFLARFAAGGLRARRGVLLYVNDEYGEGLRRGIVSAFTGLGGRFGPAVPLGDGMDVSTVLAAALAGEHPGVIFCACRATETALVLRAARRLRPGVPVVAGDGAYYLPRLMSDAGPDLSGLYVLAFWVYDSADAGQRTFAAAVQGVWRAAPKPEDALTVDALGLAGAAVAAAGNDREAVARWLRGLGTERPPFHGLTGEITFGPTRAFPLAMVRFEEGRAVRVPFSLVAPAAAP